MSDRARGGGSRVAPALAVAVALLVGGRARAQTPPLPQEATFSPQLFHPAVGPDEFFTVEPVAPVPHLNYSVGLWLNYARGGYTLYNAINCDASGNHCSIGDTRADVLRDALSADLVFALGLFDRFQVGLGLPLALYQDGDPSIPGSTDPATGMPYSIADGAFALGDPWIDVKGRIWGRDRGAQVGADAWLTLPLSRATANSFGGDSNVDVGIRALAGWESERFRAGIEFGALFRAHESHYLNDVVGQQLLYGAGFAYDVIGGRRLSVIAELYGHSDLSAPEVNSLEGNPLELDVGAKYRFLRWFYANLGIGTGVVRGLGAPVVRVFGGLTFAPDRRDRDHDGVPDVDDKCPDTPEDKDGFQDDDGCPDPDNDGDGIPDARDKCPNEAEDYDGFQDEDGCPELDNDKDGIPDIRDACPMDPEDHKGPKPMDGCPLDKTDSDGDGIPDTVDKCPLDPEDKDGFQDEDGCPDVDNDDDGIPDQYDKCPNEPEDKDGFEDDDGCPDPDNDRDGVDDKDDKCPNEKETINGVKDEDGCPDKGPPPKVQLVGDELVLLDKVTFIGDGAVINPRSFDVLKQTALTIKANPQLTKVEVDAHTDNVGDAAKNEELSQQRAQAVVDFLVGRGVARARLVAKGWGGTKPVADNATARGREANRRVEMHVLEQERPGAPKEEAPPPPPAEEAPPAETPAQ